jgi:MFS superfamily sulfate permease-like transporter
VANLAGGLFQTLPAGGGLSQTAVNDGAGAFTGVVALLTLLFLTGVLADLPQATLGALVVVSALGLVSLGPLREIGAIHHRGYRLGLVTLVAVLALGVLDGVLVGVLTSTSPMSSERASG